MQPPPTSNSLQDLAFHPDRNALEWLCQKEKPEIQKIRISPLNLSQLESHLWEAANILRGVEALVLDAEVLDSILKDANPAKKAREVEIKLIARLRKHAGNPKFKEKRNDFSE